MFKTVLTKLWQNSFKVIVVALLALLFFNRGCKKEQEQPSIQHFRDTVWIAHDTTIYLQGNSLQPIKRIHDTAEYNNTFYVPSENYDSLVEQFAAIKDILLTKNIYSNEYKHDSSSVVITDTLEKNRFVGRRVDFHLKYPIITDSTIVTLPAKKKRLGYIGGGIEGNKTKIVNSVELGFMYKDKKDRLYGIGIGSDFKNQTYFEAKAYFPIHLKK